MGNYISNCSCKKYQNDTFSQLDLSSPDAVKQELTTDISMQMPDQSVVYNQNIIKIQSYWRGYKDRVSIKAVSNSKTEGLDLFHKNILNVLPEREERPAQLLKNGVVYIGQ